MTQNFEPTKAICAHLNAFHVYANDTTRCVETDHYCSHISADVCIPPLLEDLQVLDSRLMVAGETMCSL